MSARYHARRRGWYDALSRTAGAAAAVFGSAAFAAILGDGGRWAAPYFAFTTAVAGVLNMAFAPSEKGRKEDSLYRHFCELAAEIAGSKSEEQNDVRSWDARRLLIDADAFAPRSALAVICHNEEAEARGYSDDQKFRVRWYQGTFAHVGTLPPNKFEPLA
jgi:hypothetical protein